MRRVTFILSIILLAGLAAYLFLFRNNTTLNPFTSDFALSDPGEVTKIIIYDKYGTGSLLKTTEGWEMDRVIIYQKKVEDLLLLANLIESRSPAPSEFTDRINECIDEGKKITFYHDGKVLKSFSLCKFNQALYARKSNTRNVFRISARGYSNTDLTAIVSSRLQDWQQNIILDIVAQNIKLVSVSYNGIDKAGFTLLIDNTGKPLLFDEEKNPIEQHIHFQRVQEYLYSFSGIRYYPNAQKQVDDFPDVKSPFFELKIAASDSVFVTLAGYRFSNPETGKFNPEGFYANHPDYGLILLKYSDFDPILVELDYFLKN